jgi:hypothetical protein
MRLAKVWIMLAVLQSIWHQAFVSPAHYAYGQNLK